eukprot:CAMPEP_0172364704 /NCGR_PEP_ID=MMETSP1060-20121228/7758_1 /TAXON_ID=37318 /ORGANISM="Pseudo-nitzschia pungens, Strain cf. cingulata" /LENGTH=486 /DNA_ID=CAMNT_0013087761 /DNA_START=170 /DNA_END=1631 /DNA_ORIENTATION=-
MTNDGSGSGSSPENRTRSPHLFSSVARSHSNGSRPSPPSSNDTGNPTTTTTTTTTLYHPSIFRYTCTGKLSLDSRNGGQSKASAGVCHGIQSKLEHIDHWRLSTREEAIKQFEYKSSVDIGGGGGAADDDYYGAGGDASSTHAEQAVYISGVLLYPPPSEEEGRDPNGSKDDDNDNDNNGSNSNSNSNNDKSSSSSSKRRHNPKQKQKPIKETMMSRKNTDGSTTVRPREDRIDCYGSTEVDLLVLRPQDAREESIAGVAPFCSPGATVRDVAIAPTNLGVGSETGGRERTTTIRLGILEIVYATVLEGLEEGNDNENDNYNNNNNDYNNSGKGMARNENAGNDAKHGDDSSPNNAAASGGILPGAPILPMRVVSSGKKILHHMSINGRLLYQTVQDDFPQRTYDASKRVTNEFQKTWDRTTGLMKKVASVAFFGDDWDDDDDDDVTAAVIPEAVEGSDAMPCDQLHRAIFWLHQAGRTKKLFHDE